MTCDRCGRDIILDDEFIDSTWMTHVNTHIDVCKFCFEWLTIYEEHDRWQSVWKDDKIFDVYDQNYKAFLSINHDTHEVLKKITNLLDKRD